MIFSVHSICIHFIYYYEPNSYVFAKLGISTEFSLLKTNKSKLKMITFKLITFDNFSFSR